MKQMMGRTVSRAATAFVLVASIAWTNDNAKDELVWISVASDELALIPFTESAEINHSAGSQETLVQMRASELPLLSARMHEKFGRCGGFFLEGTDGLPKHSLRPLNLRKANAPEVTSTVDDIVPGLLSQVQESNLRATILKLSSYRNRYHGSETGKQSQQWVLEQWRELTKNIPGVEVSLYNHRWTQQPSVRLVWPAEGTDEIVVLGGHGDSIVNNSSSNRMEAPGADDNASGIATITEVIRILAASGYKPKRNIHFFSYAAEEVGLWGSKEIASDYHDQDKKVVAVMQLDMTNFKGESTDIALITDNTSPELNKFTESLLSTYLPDVKWSRDRCGYACSDHASWNRYGFPSTFPFEAAFEEYNPNIHSRRDTLSQSGDNANHAVPFVKVSLAYVVKQSS